MSDTTASRRALLGGAFGMGGIALAASGGGPASAAPIPLDPSSDFFLSIATIPGESTDQQFPDTLELLTWSFGVTSSVSAGGGGGAAAGKSRPSDFVFVARSSKASPKLFLACATGKHLSPVVLNAARPGERRIVYLTVRLEKAVVTSYQVAPGEQDGFPLDVVRLAYTRLIHTVRSQNPDGSLATTTAGFDFAANKSL